MIHWGWLALTAYVSLGTGFLIGYKVCFDEETHADHGEQRG